MIKRLRSSGDNYSYVIHSGTGGEAALVDPVATKAVEAYLETNSLEPTVIINTHGHGDHTGGNSHFNQQGTRILCHQNATGNIPGYDQTLTDGETVTVGETSIEVLHTPGHTPGSICLLAEDTLISGDTVFLAGCGNPKFGGDTRDLFNSFNEKIKPLADHIELFPGHDYARKNLRFARTQEPENSAIDRKLDQVSDSDQEPSSTIGEEKQYNPFFRYDNTSLRASMDQVSQESSDWDVFRTLRELRNQW